MGIRSLFVPSLAVLTIITVDSSSAATGPAAEVQDAAAIALYGPKVSLGCQLAASDVVRVHTIRNTTGQAIPAGTKIRFSNAHGDKGVATLSAPLGPNATTTAQKTGLTPGGSCTAYFFGGHPDLVITGLSWQTGTTLQTARLTIKNNNAFVDAPASRARVSAHKCPESLIQTKDVGIPIIPKGSFRNVLVPIGGGNAEWLSATVNFDGAIRESNRTNNGYTTVGVCVK